MDTITRAILAVNSPLLHSAGILIDQDLFYLLLVVSLVLIFERRDSKRMKIFASFFLTVVAVTIIKGVIAEPRPCAGQLSCPKDYSFPSLHAAIAFTLMLAFLNKPSYLFFLLFALFVAFTRINIGVHVFIDIAAALPVALFSYYFTDKLFSNVMIWKKKYHDNYSTSSSA